MIKKSLRLRHLLPSQWMSLLTANPVEWKESLLPAHNPEWRTVLQGIESLSVDDSAMRVAVVGQADAVKGLESLTRMLDRPGQHIQLDIRLMESPTPFSSDDLIAATFGGSEKWLRSVKTLCEAKAKALNNVPVSTCLFFQGQLIWVNAVAQVNQDRSVTVVASTRRDELSESENARTVRQSSATSTRRLKSGQSLVFFADAQQRTFLLVSARPVR